MKTIKLLGNELLDLVPPTVLMVGFAITCFGGGKLESGWVNNPLIVVQTALGLMLMYTMVTILWLMLRYRRGAVARTAEFWCYAMFGFLFATMTVTGANAVIYHIHFFQPVWDFTIIYYQVMMISIGLGMFSLGGYAMYRAVRYTLGKTS